MNVFITGANRGLGLALVHTYAARGDTVHATARSPNDAHDLRAVPKVQIHALDVADSTSIGQCVDGLGALKFDLVINNAGINNIGAEELSNNLVKLDFSQGEQMLLTNALGPLRVAQALADHVAGGGKLINISSQMASMANNSSGGHYFYRMSKAALNMASKTLAIEWRSHETTVVAMHPGWVQTRLGGNGATTSASDSAAQIARTVDALTLKQTGSFLNYDGTPLPF